MTADSGSGDDWRTTVELADKDHHSRFSDALRGRRLAREARAKVGERVTVTHDGTRLFLYTDTDEGARAVEQVAHDLLEEHGLPGTVAVMRWHPLEERWEDAGVRLPATEEERAAELARGGDDDRALSARQGYDEWEVRLVYPTREAAAECARRLTDEGVPFARGGVTLVVGAPTEQDAGVLAERLRALVPAGASLTVEVNRAEAWAQAHPFPFLGGLGN